MNIRYLMLIAFFAMELVSCKKDSQPDLNQPRIENPDGEDSPTIAYRAISRKLKSADLSPMDLDINEDGTIDFSFFTAYVVNDIGVRFYAGVNPIFGAATSADAQNDHEFLNMGNVHVFSIKDPIRKTLAWDDEHALLSVRHEARNGSKTYSGNWGDGKEKIMALRFQAQAKTHYGWARLKFDKLTEELILIDAAWNTIHEQEITAGAK